MRELAATEAQIKSCFSLYNLLPTKSTHSKYTEYCNSVAVNDRENILEEHHFKRAKIVTETFISGRQRTIQDINALIGNAAELSSTMVKFNIDTKEDVPIFLQNLISVADYMCCKKFEDLFAHYSPTNTWMGHTIISSMQAIFMDACLTSSDPDLKRCIYTESTIPIEPFLPMLEKGKILLENLQITFGHSLPSFLNEPPATYEIFYPEAFKQLMLKKNGNGTGNTSNPRTNQAPKNDNNDKNQAQPKGDPKNTPGFIRICDPCNINTLTFPKNLQARPCKYFWVEKQRCNDGKNCAFSHKIFPREYSNPDIVILKKWEEAEPGVTWGQRCKDNLAKM